MLNHCITWGEDIAVMEKSPEQRMQPHKDPETQLVVVDPQHTLLLPRGYGLARERPPRYMTA